MSTLEYCLEPPDDVAVAERVTEIVRILKTSPCFWGNNDHSENNASRFSINAVPLLDIVHNFGDKECTDEEECFGSKVEKEQTLKAIAAFLAAFWPETILISYTIPYYGLDCARCLSSFKDEYPAERIADWHDVAPQLRYKTTHDDLELNVFMYKYAPGLHGPYIKTHHAAGILE